MALRQKLTRTAAIDLLVEAKVVAPEDRQWVLGDRNSIAFSFGEIEARDGFFSRSDITRLIGWSKLEN